MSPLASPRTGSTIPSDSRTETSSSTTKTTGGTPDGGDKLASRLRALPELVTNPGLIPALSRFSPPTMHHSAANRHDTLVSFGAALASPCFQCISVRIRRRPGAQCFGLWPARLLHPWKGAKSPASQACRRPGALRSQSRRISLITARRSCQRSTTEGRPQNQ
jgi:hypothetical protein